MRMTATILILSLASAACAQTAAPSSQPAKISSASSVDQILDALDARGQHLSDFSARVDLTDLDPNMGSSTVDTGKTLFQEKGPGDARISVIFDSHTDAVGKTFKENHLYTLDSGWLIERDYLKKTEDRKQVLRPGEKMDLLKLGEGPFPLPIGQKKEDVKALFDVARAVPDKDDPDGTVHLILTPKPNSKYSKFKTVEIWVDTTTNMPRRIQTENPQQTDVKITDLTDVKLNVGLSDKDFALDDLPKTGWTTTEEPYSEK
jgi:outer membrane lipoprotein-sorting protein